MGLKNIEKKSLWYNLLFYYVKFWHNTVYYRKVVILNYNKVPPNESLIFTPNHQNALMDALAMLFSVKNLLVFMARSDIFKKFAPILYFLKILPIYRIRDGIDTLKKNKAVFDKTEDVLNAYDGLVILPEGNHKGQRRLRQLKKGFARIAFQTQEAGGVKQGIQVVPVGIDYDEYFHCRSRLLINFGKPISVANFLKDYQDNPAIGLNKIKERLAQEMKPLMMNIESDKYYDLIDDMRIVYRKDMCLKMNLRPDDEGDGFYADRQFVAIMDKTIQNSLDVIEEINNSYLKLSSILSNTKLNVINMQTKAVISSTIAKVFLLILTLPLFIYGYLNHLLAYQLPFYLSRKMKDEMFHSSFMFVLSMLFFPIFYIVQSFVVLTVFNSWRIAAIYLLSLPLSAIVSWKWYKLFTFTLLDLRKIKFYKTIKFAEATLLFDDIIHKINKLTGVKLVFKK